MAVKITRTYVGSIQNHQQVCTGLDLLGDSASKIWNVARWTADRIWDATGEIPDEGTLKAYMKNQSCWKDLNAQSSQKVIEELSDAFQSKTPETGLTLTDCAALSKSPLTLKLNGEANLFCEVTNPTLFASCIE